MTAASGAPVLIGEISVRPAADGQRIELVITMPRGTAVDWGST